MTDCCRVRAVELRVAKFECLVLAPYLDEPLCSTPILQVGIELILPPPQTIAAVIYPIY